MEPLTFGSLFAGIGGMDLGLERAGMKCQWQVEIDPYCRKVLAKHWPDVRREKDVRYFLAGKRLRRDWRRWSVDVIAGGFPCQDISYAGRGAGLKGERSGLWYEFARIVRILRPRYVIVENVAALLTRGLDSVLGTLATIGYDSEWACIPAASVGAPHIRDRVFIVAHSANEQCKAGRGCEGPPKLRGAEFDVRGSPDLSYTESVGRRKRRQGRTVASGEMREASWCDVPDADKSCKHARTFNAEMARTQLALRAGWWKSEPNVGRVAYGVPARVDRLRGLGNAVVPQVAEYVGRCVMQYHKENQ